MKLTPHQFKQIRKVLGYTQSQLADELGVNPVTVRKWETPAGASTARPPNPIACRFLEANASGEFKPNPALRKALPNWYTKIIEK